MADSVAGGTSEYDGAKPRSEAAGAVRVDRTTTREMGAIGARNDGSDRFRQFAQEDRKSPPSLAFVA